MTKVFDNTLNTWVPFDKMFGEPYLVWREAHLDRIARLISLRAPEDTWGGVPQVEMVGLSKQLGFSNTTCDHDYVNAGFTSILMVCKKCNQEKK